MKINDFLYKEGFNENTELLIATSCYYSYWLAKNVLKGRFRLGERTISKATYWSYKYAVKVKNSRFLLGEKIISKYSHNSYLYIRDLRLPCFRKGCYFLPPDNFKSFNINTMKLFVEYL